MEVKCGPLTFFSNFDSGNLAKVERVKRDTNSEDFAGPQDQTTGNDIPSPSPDFEYNLWTAPDCAGSEYENLNRTWFYFGVKGCQAGKLVKLNLMNLNKQGKLYNQGMAPFVKVLPCRNKWERIRERPSYEVVGGQFQLSFVYRFPEQRNIVCYFAFCYPYSYEETQSYLHELDAKFKHSDSTEQEQSYKLSNIYYHRELLCKSLDGLRVDLLTVTSQKGMLQTREPRLTGLFPDLNAKRANQFKGKKVFVLTSRVHPGETPASYVFKGFLDFITREDDPRAMVLRDRFVFKLVPLLNPDGVKRGHYRTDQRGVNLNRVYHDPSFDEHPSIYAVRALLAYHHEQRQTSGCSLGESGIARDELTNKQSRTGLDKGGSCEQEGPGDIRDCGGGTGMKDYPSEEHQISNKDDGPNVELKAKESNGNLLDKCVAPSVLNREDSIESNNVDTDNDLKQDTLESSEASDSACDVVPNPLENINPAGKSPQVEQALSASAELSDISKVTASATEGPCDAPRLEVDLNKNELPLGASQEETAVQKECISAGSNPEDDHNEAMSGNVITTEQSTSISQEIPREPRHTLTSDNQGNQRTSWLTSDGLGFYVDLHGHASKRGCFMYGNYMEDDEQYVQCLLYPKLISINSAHFDFTACNFTEKNMYSRDKRDGMSKEGSGRVAMYKMTGSPHCYTLECNYNCGQATNPVPPATCDAGRATPPPPPGFPPRYTTEMYEEVGRAVAISALDMINANPWSRLPNSEHGCLEGVRNWLCRYLKNCSKNGATIQRKIPKGPVKPASVVTNVASTAQRVSLQKCVPSTNDGNVQNGVDTTVISKTVDKIVAPRQRSSMNMQCFSNKKFSSIASGPCRNQATLRTKDLGRKRLDVTKTAPLLMISRGDKNAHQVKLERCENRLGCEKQESFINYDRQKLNVGKKFRNNVVSMRMENISDGNGDCENDKKSKLQGTISVRHIDCPNAATAKRDMPISKSSISNEEKVKGTSNKLLKRPIISRRRRTRRTIQTEPNKVSCELVDVQLMPGNEVMVTKNSSQVSL